MSQAGQAPCQALSSHVWLPCHASVLKPRPEAPRVTSLHVVAWPHLAEGGHVVCLGSHEPRRRENDYGD